jgi:hypothetical protein
MYQMFSRKTLLSMTLWMGVLSCFPQTQAFACWWNCCCCCHQEEPKPTVSHKKPLLKDDQRSEKPSGYGTVSSQTHPLAQPQLQDPPSSENSRLPIVVEHRDEPTIVTLLPSSQQGQKQKEPSLLSSASLVIPLESPYYLEWAAETFKSTSCRKIWTVNHQTYGATIFGDEELSLALDDLAKVVFPQIPQKIWEKYALSQRSACKNLLYNKVAHYALDGVREDIGRFVTTIEALWEEDPQAFSLAHFQFRMKDSSARYWYFFAKKGSRILYIRTPYIEGINDQRTGSQSATRSSSRIVSEKSSPRKSKEPEERKVSVQDKKASAQDKKSSTKTNGTGSDSDE